MHRIFTITELVAHIAAYLPLSSCVSLALTDQQHFYPVALERLWAEQQSLVPLLKTLPQDAWQADNTMPGDFHLLRPLTPSDWERPCFLAGRIRTLCIRDGQDPHGATAIRAILDPSKALIPGLRHLSWDVNLGSLPWLKLLLQGANVVGLELGVDEDTAGAVSSVLKAARCQLHSLDVYYRRGEDDTDRDDIHTVSAAISGLVPSLSETLRFLRLPFVESVALASVSALPQLRSLGASLVVSHPGKFPATPFPRLEELIVSAFDLAVPSSLLRVLQRKLRKLALTLDLPTAEGLHAFFATAEGACLEQELQVLKLSIRNDANDQVPAVAFCDLHRFFHHRCLVDVDIETSGKLDLNDAGAWQIARAWPLVECLRIIGARTATPELTLGALLSFVTFCPHLTKLQLALDARQVPELAEERPKLSHCVRFTPRSSSPLPPEVGPVVDFLCDIFPVGIAFVDRPLEWEPVLDVLRSRGVWFMDGPLITSAARIME